MVNEAVQQHLQRGDTQFSITFQGDTSAFLGQLDDNYIWRMTGNDDYVRMNISQAGMSWEYTSTQATVSFAIEYLETAAERQYVKEQVHTILGQILTEEMSEREKVKHIHDYIVSRLSYDTNLQNYSAYKALTTGRTVCQGYAMLTQEMMTQAGIPARIVIGYASPDDGQMNGGLRPGYYELPGKDGHAWNMVKIGTHWYQLDCTWDDPVPDEPERILHDYYNRTDQELSIDHTWSTAYEGAAPYPIADTPYSDREDPVELPQGTLFGKQENVEPNKVWTVRFNAPVDVQTIHDQTVRVVNNRTGKSVAVTLEMQEDGRSVRIISKGYTSGETYTLWIGSEVQSQTKKALKEPVTFVFSVR